MKYHSYYSLLALFTLFLFSCKKEPIEDSAPIVETGDLTIYFENFVGDQPLELSDDYTSTWYITPHGDSFTMSRYSYYITDITFIREDGYKFSDESLNFLVKEEDEMSHFDQFSNIPIGTYKQVELVLGVDSIYNVTGAHSGVFDPIHGMYWDWNTGFIMAKFEGNSPVSPAYNGMVAIHLGGYKGKFNTVKKITLDFPEDLVISKNSHPVLTFQSDVMSWLIGDPDLDFSETYAVMDIGSEAYNLALRYHNHLTIKSIKP